MNCSKGTVIFVNNWEHMVYRKNNIKRGVLAAFILSATCFAKVSAQNVGIGTSSPNSKLSVKGGFSVGTDYADTATAPSNGAAFQGSVGIGTSNPQKPLDIAGAGGIRISRTESMSANNEILFLDNGQIRSVDNNHRIIFDRANNLFEIMEYGDIIMSPGASAGTRTQKVTFKANGDVSIGSLGSGLVKSVSGVLSNASAGDLPSGSGYYIQNTTSQQTGANYNIAGSGTVGTSLTVNGNNSNINSLIVNNSTTTAGTVGTYPLVVKRAGTTDFSIGSDASYAYLQSWNTKPLLINSQGNNVAIGNVNPTYKLDVSGDIRGGVYRTTVASGNVYQLGDDAWLTDVNTANTIALEGSSNNAVAALQLGTNANSYIYGSGGTVGIRTTATTQDFNVGGKMYISNGVIQSGNGAAVTATSDLGLYSTTDGNWIRIVSNRAPIKFFVDGNTSPGGGTEQFAVQNDGTLTWTKNESSGTALLPDAFCVVINVSGSCPTNWDQRDVKWDTADSYNADSGKDGKIAVDAGNSSSVQMRFCCRGSGW